MGWRMRNACRSSSQAEAGQWLDFSDPRPGPAPDRRISLGMRWLVDSARKRNGKTHGREAFGRVRWCIDGIGAAVKRREDTTAWPRPTRPSVITSGRPMMTQAFPRADPQHRDHRAYRRGQDHRDRADPLLHQEDLQDRRGPRRRRDDGLDAAGAGAGHHDHRRRDDLLLARPSNQFDRHARPQWISQSRVERASLRVLDGAVVVFDGVAGVEPPVGDGLATGRSMPRAALLLRQKLDRTARPTSGS